MGGGGSIGFMNSVIKNNRKLLKRNERRKKDYGSTVSGGKVEFKVSNVQPHKLKRIKSRLQNEQNYLRQKRIFVFGLLMTVLVTVILYFMY